MFARRRINNYRRTTFSQLDRAARLTEQVENARPFYEWVKANDKQPKYFANWPDVIAEYYSSAGLIWTAVVPVPSPYGYMGYELLKPPKVEKKRGINEGPNGEIIFPCEKKAAEIDEEALFELMCGSDSDDEEESDGELSLIEDSDDDEDADTTSSWCGKGKAIKKKLTLEDVPPGTNLRDLPKGTRLEDLPAGACITINDSDIEFGSEIDDSDLSLIEDSDDEDEEDAAPAQAPSFIDIDLDGISSDVEYIEGPGIVEYVEEPAAPVLPIKKACRCGSTCHRRISHRSCPLNKRKKKAE